MPPKRQRGEELKVDFGSGSSSQKQPQKNAEESKIQAPTRQVYQVKPEPSPIDELFAQS
jgi:hypothetical protein